MSARRVGIIVRKIATGGDIDLLRIAEIGIAHGVSRFRRLGEQVDAIGVAVPLPPMS